MPDTTVEPGGSGPYDRPVEARVSRLEEQMSDLKPILARIEAVLPHLATAAQVAELKGDLERKFAEFTGTIELKQAQFAGSMESKLAQSRSRESSWPNSLVRWNPGRPNSPATSTRSSNG